MKVKNCMLLANELASANARIREQQTVINQKDNEITRKDCELKELNKRIAVMDRDYTRMLQIQRQYIQMAAEINVIKLDYDITQKQVKDLQQKLKENDIQLATQKELNQKLMENIRHQKTVEQKLLADVEEKKQDVENNEETFNKMARKIYCLENDLESSQRDNYSFEKELKELTVQLNQLRIKNNQLNQINRRQSASIQQLEQQIHAK